MTGKRSAFIEIAALFTIVIGSCAAIDRFKSLNFVTTYMSAAIPAIFIYVPALAIIIRKREAGSYGLNADKLLGSIIDALAASAIFLPVFYLAVSNYGSVFLEREFVFRPEPINRYILDFIAQVVFVSFPEEFFYRGYIQARLNEVTEKKSRTFGVAFGPSLVVTSALFALGHFLIGLQAWRLDVFFPSLIFGWLREKRGNIISAVIFHGVANVFMKMIETGFGLH